ncbi:MAG: DUF4261 domain-containing protein [Planctomycetaceae bacterium]
MAKGLFTQGICILLERAVDLNKIEAALSGFEIVGRHEANGTDDPTSTLVLRFRPEVEGHVLVSLSPNPWPDDMGDPEDTPELFVAWSLGQFGPLAFPGCLERACEQSWAWEEGRDLPRKHTAHIRILTSYVLGSEEDEEVEDVDAPLLPEDYDSLAELQFLMKVASPLLELPGAICYFNPGGEVLRDETGLRQGLNYAWMHDLPPLDMWTNVRLYKATDTWSLMDTVGNGQFDQPDMEAVFQADAYKVSDVEEFLRNASLFMLREQEEVEDGDTADGPGGIPWQVLECDEALADPPRPTLRWVPQDGRDVPAELLDTGIAEDEGDDEDEEDDEDRLDEEFDEEHEAPTAEERAEFEGELRALGDEELDELLGPDRDESAGDDKPE